MREIGRTGIHLLVVMIPASGLRGGKPLFNVKRREFITLLGSVAAAWPLAARACEGLVVPDVS